MPKSVLHDINIVVHRHLVSVIQLYRGLAIKIVCTMSLGYGNAKHFVQNANLGGYFRNYVIENIKLFVLCLKWCLLLLLRFQLVISQKSFLYQWTGPRTNIWATRAQCVNPFKTKTSLTSKHYLYQCAYPGLLQKKTIRKNGKHAYLHLKTLRSV